MDWSGSAKMDPCPTLDQTSGTTAKAADVEDEFIPIPDGWLAGPAFPIAGEFVRLRQIGLTQVTIIRVFFKTSSSIV